MKGETRKAIGRALDQVDRPGSYCVSGNAPAVLPGLEVEGLGPIGLPLAAGPAKELIKFCQQAPYGKGEQTLVDPAVRRVWRLGPDRFSLTNPDWARFLAEAVAKVRVGLGLEGQELKCHLYDLLLYEPGGFFLPHRDGEKLDRMVATLVIVLPSTYEGGELVVRHDGQERIIDFAGTDASPFHIHYAAFYADCEHEIRPLRTGYRLGLVYNLTLAKSKKAIPAPRDSEHIERLACLLREWSADDEAGKLVIPLEHQYTPDGIAWDALKGVDRARARVLLAASDRAGCKGYLALLTLHESGEAEEVGGYGSRYGRRRRYGDYGDDGGEYKMGEIYETKLTADHWSDGEGQGLPIGELNIDEEEVLDPDSLREVEPEEHVSGFTGNEGQPMDRWYRHAAVVLWPERRHFEMICDRDSRAVIPALKQMVASRKGTRGGEAAALKNRCLELAAAILAKWPEDRHTPFRPVEIAAGDLLESIAALDEPRPIAAFLGGLMIRDESVDPGQALVTTCQKYGWGTFREPLLAIMKGTNGRSMGRNVRILERIASARPRKKEGWDELCRDLARELVPAVEAIDNKPAANSWYEREADRSEILAGMARSLILTDQGDLLARFVTHALALPKKYPLTDAHMPALLILAPWLRKHVKPPIPALTAWLASCREQLESRTARAPEEPADFRRSAAVNCKCEECAELKRFLADPREAEHRFRARQERRDHVENTIRNQKLDLDTRTERTGSPHTLICTKNTASYRVKLAEYHRDLEHLAAVRSIEAALPK